MTEYTVDIDCRDLDARGEALVELVTWPDEDGEPVDTDALGTIKVDFEDDGSMTVDIDVLRTIGRMAGYAIAYPVRPATEVTKVLRADATPIAA